MPRPASDIRERLIEAARVRFLHEGVDGASLRGVAKDAETNIGMVYYYFKTKDDLFFAVVEEVYAKLVAEWSHDLSADTSPEQKLRGIYARISRLTPVETDVLRLVLREAMVSSQRLARLIRRFEQGHIPMMLAALRDGVAAGDFDSRPHIAVLLASTLTLAFFPQIAHRLVSTAAPEIAQFLPTREDAAQQLADVLLHGISKR
jgi:TetR/AcrR family transcriptional regulator